MARPRTDFRLYTPHYVDLSTMPAGGVIPDGIVVVRSTLYAGGEALGTVLDVSPLREGGYLIRYR